MVFQNAVVVVIVVIPKMLDFFVTQFNDTFVVVDSANLGRNLKDKDKKNDKLDKASY